MQTINIFTDGSCDNKPNRREGANWCVILNDKFELLHEIGTIELHSSNTRQEMFAIKNALLLLATNKINYREAIVYSDSEFMVNSFNKGWLQSWLDQNILHLKKNEDIWEQILPLLNFKIKFKHIRGHQKENGSEEVKWNNYCDRRCGEMRKLMLNN